MIRFLDSSRFGRMAAMMIGICSLPAYSAVISNFSITGADASSTVSDNELLCFNCDITYTVNNGDNAAHKFNWTGPGFAGTAPANGAATATITTDQAIVTKTGNISFPNDGTAFPAPYKTGVPSLIIYYGGKLFSALDTPNQDIQFTSQITQISSSSFEYEYTVMNSEDYSVPFSWDAAGYSGTVGPLGTVTMTLFSSMPANEILGHASFTLADGPWVLPAYTFVPAAIPEPASFLLVGVALLFLGGGWIGTLKNSASGLVCWIRPNRTSAPQQ